MGQIPTIDCKKMVKRIVIDQFKNSWTNKIKNVELQGTRLKQYSIIKTHFHTELYLDAVDNPKYRNAITRIRTNSHTLEIERGRFTKPKTPLTERKCSVCNVVEDEVHFVCACSIYENERKVLFSYIDKTYSNFHMLNNNDKFIHLFAMENRMCINLLGKYLYNAFRLRNEADCLNDKNKEPSL